MSKYIFDKSEVLYELADEVVCKDNIGSFLELLSNNIHLSVVNLAVLYKQDPAAKCVCGKKAVEKIGVKVDESKAYTIYFPRIAMESPPEEFVENGKGVADKDYPDIQFLLKEASYKSLYLPVKAYSVEDDDKKNNINFIDRILLITGATIEFVASDGLPPGDSAHGYYDREQNIFYIEKDLPKELMDTTIVELYIVYVLVNYGIEGKLIKLALRQLCTQYFSLSGKFPKVLFKGLDELNTDEKAEYLITIWRLGTEIIQDIKGYHLSFDETAFVNNFMVTDEPDELFCMISRIMDGLDDDLIKHELELFQKKLLKAREGYLNDLLGWREQKVVLTYPPMTFDIEETDWLRSDRREFIQSIFKKEGD